MADFIIEIIGNILEAIAEELLNPFVDKVIEKRKKKKHKNK